MGRVPAFIRRWVSSFFDDPDWWQTHVTARARRIALGAGGFVSCGVASYASDLAPYVGLPEPLVEVVRWACITTATLCGWSHSVRAPTPPTDDA